VIKGTPKGGRDDIAELAYTSGILTLVAYTNPADSLGVDTVAADLVQPTSANGYAPIVMNGVWSTLDGVVTYVHSSGTHPRWTATGPWSATVTGTAIIRGTRVRHFKDNAVPFVAVAAKVWEVNVSTLVGP
jgi:hypothetical protein